MKKIASFATMTLMSCACLLQGLEPLEFIPRQQTTHFSKCNYHCKTPSGSYYVDSSSQNPLQQILILNQDPPITAPVHFSGTNVNAGVTLSADGNSIIVHKKGYYKIEWNATLSLVAAFGLNYHFNLQKNGTTLLNPIPQVDGQIHIFASGTPYTSAAASVIVPLAAGDEISLLLTVDGSEGNFLGDGVQIESAQISGHFISKSCP